MTTPPTDPRPRRVLLAILIALLGLGGIAVGIVAATTFLFGPRGAGDTVVVSQLPEGTRIVVALRGDDVEEADLVGAARVLTDRFARMDIPIAGIALDTDTLVIGFDGEAADDDIARARQLIAVPLTLEFRAVIRVDECTALDPPFAETVPSELVACDRSGEIRYVLGPVAVDGATVEHVDAGFDDSIGASIQIRLDPEGAEALARLTEAAADEQTPRDQVALYVGGRVITAPAVVTPITNGEIQISGALEPDEARAIADEIGFAARNLELRVASVG